jgi:hypothetical protein
MPDSTDRRASDRLPVNAGTGCSFVGPVQDVGPGRVRDVSMEGIGLLLAHRVEIGCTLAIALANPERGFAKTLLVRVAHVTAVPGGFLVGGSFTAPLTYQELTTLVM